MRKPTRNRRKGRKWTGLALVMAALTLLMLAAPAFAKDDDEAEESQDPFAGLYRRHGLYLAAMGNYMVLTDKDGIESDLDRAFDAVYGPYSRSNAKDSWGVNGRLGYRVNERIAVETQFEFLNDIRIDTQYGPSATRTSTHLNMFAVSANARGYLSGRGRVQPYGLFGAGWGRARVNPPGSIEPYYDNGAVIRFGGGVDLYGKPDVALTLEASYVRPLGDLDGLQYVSIGAGFMLRFYGGQ